MRTLRPDIRIRLAATEGAALSLEGAPSSARATYLSDGREEQLSAVEGGFALKPSACPDLAVVSWEVGGVTVSGEVQIVSSPVCSVSDVKSYRADQYMLKAGDDEIAEAIERCVEIVERALRRRLQPVLEPAVATRGFSRSAVAYTGDVQCSDMRSIASARLRDGSDADVSLAGTSLVDVSGVGPGKTVELVVEHGMLPTPPDARGAVAAFAAWYLSPKGAPDNATSASTDAGVVSYVVEGVNAPTSIPEVNALVERYGLRGLEVG